MLFFSNKKHYYSTTTELLVFPIDVILEILLRLPETDLIASKFVSQDWNFVISRVCLPRLYLPYPSALLCGLLFFEDYEGSIDPVTPDVYPDRTVEKYWTLKFVAIGKYSWNMFAGQVVRGHPIIPDHIMPLLPSRELKPSETSKIVATDFCSLLPIPNIMSAIQLEDSALLFLSTPTITPTAETSILLWFLILRFPLILELLASLSRL
ncbi:hypothetical protein OROGR_023344 [Orobanche gracilis]